jgi:thiamine biosynthesis lipoprotein
MNVRGLTALALLAAAFAVGAWVRRCPVRDPVQTQSRFLMDTFCTIRVPGRPEALRVVAKAFDRMAEIDRRFNALNPKSPIHEFNEKGTPITDPEILRLVRTASDVAEKTDGAFDITVYPVVKLWGFYDKTSSVPSAVQIRACLDRVNWRDLALDDNRLTPRRAGLRIDLGGIAKGYAVGEAVRVLKASGVRSALVDAGGDLYAFGQINGRAWRAGVRNPRGDGIIARLDLHDESVTTSGDYERFFEKDGVRYHHIMDPRTGYPARGVVSVTIVSKDATLADAWSTALFVLGAERGLPLVEKTPGIDAMVVTEDGRTSYSSGMRRRIAETRQP